MTNKRELFILNPAAGTDRVCSVYENAVRNVFGPDARVVRTTRQGHARELTQQAVQEGMARVTAIGGDGTINEISQVLVGTSIPLGVIPKGSGNGFAREFNIPLNPLKACRFLARSSLLTVDVGQINGELFFNIAGFGLDACIARAFDQTQAGGTRGKAPYFWLGLKEYRRYRPPSITLHHDGGTTSVTPLLVAIANGKQYGGGAKIAPTAEMTDGFLTVVSIVSTPWYRLLPMIPRLFRGTLTESPSVQIIKTKKMTVTFPKEIPYHLDGEVRSSSHLTIKILPQTLRLSV